MVRLKLHDHDFPFRELSCLLDRHSSKSEGGSWLVNHLQGGLAATSDRSCCQMRGGPGSLEVEAAGDAIDVDAFAGEVEARDDAAFHGLEVDALAVDAAAGDELIFVGRLAIGFKPRLLDGF